MRPHSPSNAFLPLAVDGPTPGRGALLGCTLAVKDVYDVAGVPTRAGSPEWGTGARVGTTAAAVTAVTDAGARVVGKTVTDELAFSLMGTNAHHPRPVNRAAPDRVTGGSSSGSAAAVGWGEADVAVGTDTGGSIRAPAGFCGLVGLRTTHGRVPLGGCVPLAPSFDTGGWFAGTLALYREVALASLPPGHVALPPRPRARLCPALDVLVEGGSASEHARVREAALAHLAPPAPLDLGTAIDDLYWCFRRLQAVEAWAMHGPFVTDHGAGMNPDVRARFEWGRAVTPPEHGAAVRLRAAFSAWLADELGGGAPGVGAPRVGARRVGASGEGAPREDAAPGAGGDVLVLPTVPGPAPLAGADPDRYGEYRERALRLLCLAGLAGLPQITLPLGTVEGAPFGLSLIGPRGTDLALIDLGAAIMEGSGARQAVVPG